MCFYQVFSHHTEWQNMAKKTNPGQIPVNFEITITKNMLTLFY